MKFVFIDEFKPKTYKDNSKIMYGLSAVIIDAANYSIFKDGFDKELKKLGWDKAEEIKGRYVYSRNIYENISQKERLEFAQRLFKLSSSKTGKKNIISVMVAFDFFDKNKNEHEMYKELLIRILEKIKRPATKYRDKNLIEFIIDSNDNITKHIKEIEFYKILTDTLHEDWTIFEKPLFVSSSNLTTGIIFSDFVSFFHQKFIESDNFFENTKDRGLELLKNKEQLTEKEWSELKGYANNFQKKETSLEIIRILNKRKYCN